MAKIVHSDAAPSEAVHYSFAGIEFDLGGRKKTFETDDDIVLSNAETHPWLKVEREVVAFDTPAFHEGLRAEDDAFSAYNSVANKPEAIRATEQAKIDVAEGRVAIESGVPQTTTVETQGVAETLAADETSKTSDKDTN